MQEYLQFVLAQTSLGVVNELNVLISGRVFVFLADKVKADTHIRNRLHFLEECDLLFSVLNSKEFQAAVDNLYLEHGEAFLQGFLNALEYGDLLLDRDHVRVVVEEAAENVTELANSDHLFDDLAANVVQNLLKEVDIVVQLVGEVEFRLELVPSVSRLGERRFQ